MHECMALFTWTSVFLLFVLTLPCYTCSFAGSNSQKPVGELCV